MKVGAVLGLVLSLSLFSAAFVLRHGVTRLTTQGLTGTISVSIFMRPDASAAQAAAISSQLHADPDVRSFTYCDEACAHGEFKRMFGNSPQFATSVQASDLPASFRVVPSRPNFASAIEAEARSQPGVRDVLSDAGAFNKLVTVGNRAAWVCLGLAIASLAAAVLLGARVLNRRA